MITNNGVKNDTNIITNKIHSLCNLHKGQELRV